MTEEIIKTNNGMKVVEVNITDLKPAEYNPRKMTEKQKNEIKASIDSFGMVEPIVVNSAKERMNIIIGGHQRYYVCNELGYKTMPVVYVSIPDIKREQELNVRLNKNVAEWDYDMLANIDEELLKIVGFESEELDKIFNLDDDKDIDEVPEIPEKPKTKLGDLYQLGDHRLLCGDATKKEDVERLMGEENAKLVFTSPPYNMAGGMYENYEDNLKSEEYIRFNIQVIENVKSYLKGFIFWNISYNKNARWEFIEIIHRIIKETGLKFLELIIWDKGHALPITSKEGLTRRYEDILLVGDEESISQDLELYFLGRNDKRAYFNKSNQKGITNYWRIGTNKTQLENHLACYPVALPRKGIELMTNRGEIVLDPFLGSGTTLIASETIGRKCYGLELDPKYCDVIIQRWETLTNKTAKKLN
jgi:DNA modification methylase/DNA-directed RNA polymerase subunit F